jgi:hypothetical protein
MDPRKKSSKDDIIIIISYATLEFEKQKRSSLGLFSQMKTTIL